MAFRTTIRMIVTLSIMLSLVSGALAQQTTTPTAPPKAEPRSPDYVDFSGFKGKIFEVKNREPRLLIGAVSSLGSGFKGAEIRYSEEFRTISVRDFPENIAAIEEALKRLDTPQPPQPDVELRMHVLIATNGEAAGNPIPNDMSDVVKQMQATLNYKNYASIATVVQRVRGGARNIRLIGSAELPAKLIEQAQPASARYEYRIFNVLLSPDQGGAYSVQLAETHFVFSGPSYVGTAEIGTDLTLRNGEKVVVGTATLGNKGLILVLSAKIAK